MLGIFDRLLDPSGLTPHGFCLSWDPALIWLQAGSDAAIALSYYSIPLALAWFVRRRTDLVFPWVFWLFAIFILACGTTHVLGVLTLWLPAYWLDGSVKAVTAVVSLATALLLWPLIPQALTLPSPEVLRRVNTELQQEIEAKALVAGQLLASEARYRSLFTKAPVALQTLDAERHIVEVSDMWLDLMGYRRDEVMGRPITDFQTDQSAAQAVAEWPQIIARGGGRDIERRYVRKAGEVLDVLLSCTVETDGLGLRAIGSLTDVTRRRQAEAALRASEERLRQAEKLNTLGQIAGGVAHDFNNVLQGVLAGATMLRKRAGDQASVERFAGLVEQAAMRGASVTRRLLAFARRDVLRAQPIAVPALLEGLHEVLQHTLGPAVVIRREVEPDISPVFADRGQLETVLINLAMNSRDAMPNGGTVVLSAAAEHVEADQTSQELPPGGYVRFAVEDTGSGMSPATLIRAMEPFFTTKPVGEGTGLGLSMARGFAEQSGGHLRIDSEQGRGTTVSLWLPAASSAAAPGAARAEPARPPPCSSPTRLLLVDDDDVVRQALSAALADRGYDVLQAEGGRRALELIDAGEALDLLVTDQSMPDMDGLTLIQAAQRRRAGLPVILLTAFVADLEELATEGAPGNGYSLLRKPITPARLAERIETLLAHKETA